MGVVVSKTGRPTREPAPEGMKWCPSCGDWKSYDSFYKNRSMYDGYGGECKKHQDAGVQARRKANKADQMRRRQKQRARKMQREGFGLLKQALKGLEL